MIHLNYFIYIYNHFIAVKENNRVVDAVPQICREVFTMNIWTIEDTKSRIFVAYFQTTKLWNALLPMDLDKSVGTIKPQINNFLFHATLSAPIHAYFTFFVQVLVVVPKLPMYLAFDVSHGFLFLCILIFVTHLAN